MDGHQVPQELVIEVGEAFEKILKEVINCLLEIASFECSIDIVSYA